MKNRRNLIIGMIVVLAVIAVGIGACQQLGAQSGASPTPTPATKARSATGNIVSAEGTIVPYKQARLSFKMPGRVVEVLVKEGDTVTAGQPLARQNMRDLDNAVRKAEAALQSARAQLAKTKAGAREEEVAQAEAGVAAARAGLATAQGGLAAARANLAKLQTGTTQRQLEIAAQEVELAKNQLFGAQAQRDRLAALKDAPCFSDPFSGRVTCSYEPGSYEAAQSAVQQAEQGVENARLK